MAVHWSYARENLLHSQWRVRGAISLVLPFYIDFLFTFNLLSLLNNYLTYYIFHLIFVRWSFGIVLWEICTLGKIHTSSSLKIFSGVSLSQRENLSAKLIARDQFIIFLAWIFLLLMCTFQFHWTNSVWLTMNPCFRAIEANLLFQSLLW